MLAQAAVRCLVLLGVVLGLAVAFQISSPLALKRHSGQQRINEKRVCRGARVPAVGALSMSATTAEVDLKFREFQLEELEDKETAATSVVLNGDGSVSFGATDGPLPKRTWGSWAMDDDGAYSMTVVREFESTYAYEVTRTFKGVVEEVMDSGKTVILAGEIYMNGDGVGFFKMISNPSDITDVTEKLDDRVVEKHF